MKKLLFLTLLMCTIGLGALYAQGYAYIHYRAVSEDQASSDLEVKLTGGTSNTVYLNDDGSNIYNIYDMGASHGTGAGQLWAVGSTTYDNNKSHLMAGHILFKDNNAGSYWSQLTSGTPSVLSIDGMGDGTAVFINAYGNAYIWDNGVSRIIWNNANHGGAKLVDIASGGPRYGTSGGEIVAVAANGGVYRYYGSFTEGVSATESWAGYTNTNLTAPTSDGALRVDIWPGSPQQVAIQKVSGKVYAFSASNIAANPSYLSFGYPFKLFNTADTYFLDIAYTDDGTLYASGMVTGGYYTGYGSWDAQYTMKYTNGVGWDTAPEWFGIQPLTGGPGGQVWGINARKFTPGIKKIYSKVVDGSYPYNFWIDDERIKSGFSSTEAIMTPITGGNVVTNIKPTVPAGWVLTDIDVYDPSGNSTVDLPNKRARVKAVDNEVVHVVFTLARKKQEYNIGDNLECGVQWMEKFEYDDYGPGYILGQTPLSGLTSFHYYDDESNSHFSDGYYGLMQTTAGSAWSNGWLYDHTDDGGYFALFNASYMPDYFYYQTVNNFLVGATYEMSIWIADVSPVSPRRPVLEFGVRDVATGDILEYEYTPEITETDWTEYKFKFKATQPSMQLFLRNWAPGGDGNDIALDDISFKMIKRPVTSLSVPGTICTQSASGPAPTYQLAAVPAGGTWTSLTTNLVTINATTGLATAVLNANGSARIKYTYTHANGCDGDTTIVIPVTSSGCTPPPPPPPPIQTTDPDYNVTFVNVPVFGDVSTNDDPRGVEYGQCRPVIIHPDFTDPSAGGNPNSNLPTVNTDGTYDFMSDKPGVYNFIVPVKLSDGTCVDEMLTITVLSKNGPNPPVANPDWATTLINKPVTLKTLANDYPGTPGSKLVPASVQILTKKGQSTTTSSRGGTVTVDPATGDTRYTPPTGYTGKDTIYYKVCDDQVPPMCANSRQIITVLPGDAPNSTVAVDDNAKTPKNTPVNGNVLTNDSDPEGDAQTVCGSVFPIVTNIANKGTLYLEKDGKYTFIPDPAFVGPLDFPYIACDARGASAKATLHILVHYVPDLTPTIYIDNLTFIADAERDFMVNISEIENIDAISKVKPIQLKIEKMSAFDITVPGITLGATPVSGISNTSNVLGGKPNQNGNWMFSENDTYITITAKDNIDIKASSMVPLGFHIKVKEGAPVHNVQALTSVIVAGSGGEVYYLNNLALAVLVINATYL